MPTPKELSLQSSRGGFHQPLSDRPRAETKDHGCPPIVASCGCQFHPCSIGLVGSMLLPHLDEPHFTTVMRNAVRKREFDEDTFDRIHRMLGIDPSPEKTDKEVRGMARIPWLLGHRYPTLPSRLEAVIRSAIRAEADFSESDRQHCFRMLGMDDGAIAARNRHRECPTCGTPEGYRVDGGPAFVSDRWRGRPNIFTGQLREQPWQADIRERMRAPRPAGPAPPPSHDRHHRRPDVAPDHARGPARGPVRAPVHGADRPPRSIRNDEERDRVFARPDTEEPPFFDFEQHV